MVSAHATPSPQAPELEAKPLPLSCSLPLGVHSGVQPWAVSRHNTVAPAERFWLHPLQVRRWLRGNILQGRGGVSWVQAADELRDAFDEGPLEQHRVEWQQ